MIQLKPSQLQGAINIESVLEVHDGFVKRLKQHESRVQALEKDLHINHILSIDESGYISKAGKMYNGENDAFEQLANIEKAHKKFIDTVEQWELPEQEQTEEDTQKCQLSDDVNLTMTRKGCKVEIEGNMALQEAIFHLSYALIKNEKPE